MDVTTRITRHGAQLFALGAIAALAAGCSAGPSARDSAESGAQGVSGVQSDVQGAPAAADGNDAQTRGAESGDSAKGAGAGQGKGQGQGQGAGNGNGQGQGKGHGNGHGNGSGGGDSSDVVIPEGWAGTVSQERFAPEDPAAYLALGNLNGSQAVTEMSAEGIAGSEFFGGSDARCEGDAVLGGTSATCTFTDTDSGEQRFADVHMVGAGFGSTALLYAVSSTEGVDASVVSDAPFALQTLGQTEPANATAADLEEAVISGVMMGYSEDGELPAELDATCEVTDGGEHALCEVTGTPDGGGDGTWYATAQRGYSGDTDAYVFTRLPQE
ncbi:hypothetical protein CFK41_00965 [Brachybacterium ginsengisoli]|uniref:Uncharacterized protein n=1 Tax=Brachybacterium ginsengisoli TaxID=1331682 RepID=A0A291GTM2_9MICO|nr:hypothetical protein [Brachybacterium ginsengisoli]ATG53502.1 hypothetical protein CFK41_00965 [Brachybacterium ginsengisoli]